MQVSNTPAWLLCLVVCLVPFLGRDTGIAVFPQGASAEDIAGKVWAANRGRLLACDLDMHIQNDRMTSAIVAIEAYSVEAYEQTIERAALAFTGMLGLPMPDWTLGVAQIRPSTITHLGIAEYSRDLAEQLVNDECYAIQMAGAIVRMHAAVCLETGRVDDCAWFVARAYNGQRSVSLENMAYLTVLDAVLALADKYPGRAEAF